MSTRTRITKILQDDDASDQDLYERLLPLVYSELKEMAHNHLRSERPGHTLNTTALVHEAYFRLVDQDAEWKNRSHFLAVASLSMRRILINHARDRARQKRGGDAQVLSLTDVDAPAPDAAGVDIIALDDALERLARINERAVHVVECRFFGGLTIAETARALGVSDTTVKHDWRTARAWLRAAMKG